MEYKVLITTSGIGNRLGELTKFTNKSLVRIGHKPAISYIVESYPENIELVVTLGHYGNQVEQFLTLAYPNRKFSFVEISPFEGPGSSLAYSILQTKDYIDCPFIFHACDTVVPEAVPEPDKNWLGGFNSDNSANYVSFDINGKLVTKLKDKGELNYDYNYIGLAGIYDYKEFFNYLENIYERESLNSQLSDVVAIQAMLHKYNFEYKQFYTWLDVGNTDGLKHAREYIKDKFEILDKTDEAIFIFDDFVIKFFYDEKICQDRVERGKYLEGLVPKILGSTNNFYKYEYVKGELLANIVTENKFEELLNWSNTYLWVKKAEKNIHFYKKCYDFYFVKTLQRINKYLSETDSIDNTCIINGIEVPPISEMLTKVDPDSLCWVDSYQFHGDYIVDNIISKSDNSFVLLDWRQDFGGDLENGDIYYDLAKLNHNLVFNHHIVNKNLFSIDIKDNNITCDILRSDNLLNCQKKLFEFIRGRGYNLNKVKLLTSLIWINMAPLHHYPLNNFLFYFGKINLFKVLNGS